MIHPTADVSAEASIGEGTIIWHYTQVREGAVLGCDCILGKGVYIDFDVRIGDRCKLQNGVSVYHGVSLGEGVFLGPGVMCLNDKYPRAVNVDGSLKLDADWEVRPSHIGNGAGIGGGAIILPGVNVGVWAMVGSGAVVSKDVPDHGLVYGNPADLVGFVCKCGRRLEYAARQEELEVYRCSLCEVDVGIPANMASQVLHKRSD